MGGTLRACVVQAAATIRLARSEARANRLQQRVLDLERAVRTATAKGGGGCIGGAVVVPPLLGSHKVGDKDPSGGGLAYIGVGARMRLDEAAGRIRKLQREVLGLRERNVELLQENAQLEETRARLKNRQNEMGRKHAEDTAWYEPRITGLEETIATTGRAFDALSLDVELMGGMYRKSCEQLNAKVCAVSALTEERNLLAKKLTESVTMASALRDECRRKDRVIMRVMASRHSLAQADKQGERVMTEKDAALARKTEQHAEMVKSRT